VIPYSDITGLVFSGKGHRQRQSRGKPGQTRRHSERKAEAERLEAEAKQLGHL